MIDQICQHFDINAAQILSHRETDDSVIVVIDYGIAGGKKHTVAKADLKPKAEPKPAASKKAPSRKRASKKAAE